MPGSARGCGGRPTHSPQFSRPAGTRAGRPSALNSIQHEADGVALACFLLHPLFQYKTDADIKRLSMMPSQAYNV